MLLNFFPLNVKAFLRLIPCWFIALLLVSGPVQGRVSTTNATRNHTLHDKAVDMLKVNPDYAISTTGNAISITDLSGNGESLSLTQNSTNIRFSVTGRTFSLDGGATTSFPADVALASVTAIVVNTDVGSDTIVVGAFSTNLPSLTINGGTGDDLVNLSGDITFATNANLDIDLQDDDASPGTDQISLAANANLTLSGTGAATLRTSRDIYFNTGSTLETTNGNLTVEANQQATPSVGSFYGVRVVGSIVRVNGTGALTIRGKGGTSTSQTGVYVIANSLIRGGTSGTALIEGTGGASTSNGNYGVHIASSPGSSTITSAGADVVINGTGGGTSSSQTNIGSSVSTGGLVSAGGSGNVFINGTGGATMGGFNAGFYIATTGLVTSSGGNVQITGQGGNTGGSSNYGIRMDPGGQLTAGSNGSVSVRGTGGTTTGNSNYGISMATDAQITSSGGPLSVSGQGGGSGSSQSNYGINIQTNGQITAGGTGSLTVVGTGGPGGGDFNYGVYVSGTTVNGSSRISSTNGDITIIGTGGGTGTSYSNYGVAVEGGGVISPGGIGNLFIRGNGGSNSTGINNRGIGVEDVNSRITTAGGNLTAVGQGGGSGASGSNRGIHVGYGGQVVAGGTGTVSLTGIGGQGSLSDNYGVYLLNDNALISSSGGNVTIFGQGGGTGNSSANYGVHIYTTSTNPARIMAGGTGTVTVLGQGGAGTGAGGNNNGVRLDGASAQITSSGGNVAVRGQGGTGVASSFNYGVNVDNGSSILAGGTGLVSVTGVGGAGTTGGNLGVYVLANSHITSSGGDVTVVGVEGAGTASVNGIALWTGGVSTSANGGNIDLVSNNMQLAGPVNTSSGGTTTLRPLTNGVQINLGGTTDPVGGPLSLSAAELNQISTGTLVVGNATSGTITVSAGIALTTTNSAMQLISAGDVLLSGGGINTNGGTLLLHPGTSPKAVKPTFTGTDVTASTLSFGSDLEIAINGTTPGNGTGSTYSQLNVAGAVDLTGVDLVISGTYTPAGGNSFTLINNDGTDAIVGTFNGLAEGGLVPGFSGGSLSAIISYVGGSGNDVVLTVSSCPSLTITSAPSLSLTTGNNVTLTASGATSYSWSSGQSTSVISVSAPGAYSVTGTTGGCSSVTSVTVTGGVLSIGNRVYFDQTGDGIQQTGEPGIPGASLTVVYNANGNLIYGDLGDQTFITTTGVDGIWTVGNLPAGDYRVAVTPPAGQGWVVTDAFDNGVLSPNIQITPLLTASRTDADFGFRSTGQINSRVWVDTNGDGVQDANEPGIPAVQLVLRYDANANNAYTDADDGSFTVTTGVTGAYSLTYLPPGNYRVDVTPSTLPDNNTPTYDLDGISTPHSATAALTLGQSLTTVNFGYFGNGTIGGRVWFDANRNGVDNAGEPGISGISVTLTFGGDDGNLGTTSDNLSYTTTTNAGGTYSFTGLFGGDLVGNTPNYRVSVTPSASFSIQTYDATAPTTDNQSSLSLVNSGSNLLQSFGYAPLCTSVMYVTQTGAGLQTGSSWTNAFSGTALQSAIDAVSACGGGQVWVAAGLYKPTSYTGVGSRNVPFQMLNNVAIYGGFAGNETTLTGPTGRTITMPSGTTLSGEIDNDNTNTNNSYHVVVGSSLNSTARLDGVVITGGNADNNLSFANLGGGIFLYQSIGSILANCTLDNNVAVYGGGLMNYIGNPILLNCVIQNNSATWGGGLSSYLGVGLTLTNCVLQNNAATSGGALHSESGRPLLTNCTVQSNSATTAGAIWITGTNFSLTLTNSIVWNNGGANSFSVVSGSLVANYSLFEPSSITAAGFISGPGNLTTSISPFANTTSVALNACTPAINAGLNSATGLTGITTDLVGNNRFYNSGVVDMGAVEFQGVGGLPASYSVLGGGTATCASSPTISLSNSETGVSYGLLRDGVSVGSSLTGTGAALSFGTQPASGTYTVLATHILNSCTALMVQSATVVSSTALPTVSIAPNVGPAPSATLTCASPSLTLTATSSETALLWSTGATSATLLVNSAGTYSVTATAANGCTVVSNSVVVSSNTALTGFAVTASGSVCAGASVTLTASGCTSGTVNWPGGITGNTFSTSLAGTYTATCTVGACSTTASGTATVGAAVTATLTSNLGGTLTCAQTSLTLTATGGTSYTFAGPGLSQSGNSATAVVSAGGIYTVTVGNAGCTSSTTTTVSSGTGTPTVSISATSGTLTCAITSLTITATSSGTGLLWSNAATTQSITVNAAGTYSVTATGANGCSAVSNSVTIGSNTAAPTGANLSASNSGTLTCAVQTLTLTASATGTSLSYVFAGLPGSGNTRPVSASGLYSVTITGANGCTTSASTTVFSNTATPTVSIAPTSGTLTCAAPSLTLTASTSGTGVRWNTTATTPSIVVSTSGTYSVTATASNGCTSSTKVTINTDLAGAAAPPTLSASSSVVCAGSNVGVVATGGASPMQWYKDGQLVSGQTSATLSLGSVPVTQSGSYVLVISGACSVTSAPFVLTVNPLPTVTLLVPSGASVQGSTITLPAPLMGINFQVLGGVSFERFIVLDQTNGFEIRQVDTNANGVFQVTRTGPFRLTVTDGNGCRRTVEGVIAVRP